MKRRFLFCLMLVLALAGPAVLADPFEYEPQVFWYNSNYNSIFGGNPSICSFNGNELPDLVVSESEYGDDLGRVHVFLDVTGMQAGIFDIEEEGSDITFIGQTDDRIGAETHTCDFNGDGISDIIFNRQYWGGREEYLFVFYGGGHWQSGTEITDLENEADVVIMPNEENENNFRRPFICGDINGDEYADVFAGGYPVAVLGGDYSSGTVLDLTESTPAVQFTGILIDDLYYRFLGDVNGDGINDFLFSEQTMEGMLKIWFGFEDYSSPIVIDPDVTPPDVTEAGPYWMATYRLVDVGDWTGDGVDDMLLSQLWSTDPVIYIYRLNPGEAGMLPGHEFSYLFAVMTEKSLRFTDMNGDNQLDLAMQAREFYWDRSAFPQTGNWEIWDYEPQGVFQGTGTLFGNVMAGNLDNDGEQDVIFYNAPFCQMELYFTSLSPDDDDDTGDDDTGDDDTGDDDTGDDDTGDDDTGDDDTGDDDTGDDDTGDDDTGDDDTGDDDTGDDDDDDTGPDDDDNDTGPDDDDDIEPDDDDDNDTSPDDDDDTSPDDDDDNDTGPDDDDDNNDDDDDDGCGC